MDCSSPPRFLSPRQLRRKVNTEFNEIIQRARPSIRNNELQPATLRPSLINTIDTTENTVTNDYSSSDNDTNERYSSCSDSHSQEEQINIRDELAGWAVTQSVNSVQLSSLLKLLKKHDCFSDLPSDSRTLLATPRETPVSLLSSGEYLHRGLEQCIIKSLGDIDLTRVDYLELQFNIDGLPLVKSNNTQFWPILGCVCNIKSSTPFVIGLFCGRSKPDDSSEFLKEFVDELITLSQSTVLGKSIRIDSFICDAPARSYILKVKGHTGYSSCLKCVVQGTREDNRTNFCITNAEKRTDISFRAKSDDSHHTGDSMLAGLNINMIDTFPYEYMHLVCLGVVKKLILLWMRGDHRVFKISSSQVDSISTNLLQLAKHMSSDFNRKPRSLREIDRWKATELRHFLLYTGPIALKKVLPSEHYDLFMCLSVAISILCSEKVYLKYNAYASQLLQYFVSQFTELYGSKHVSHNVHGLTHLPDDSKLHGPLDRFSAFKFENYLGYMKRLVHGKTRQLQQVHRRLEEYEINRNKKLADPIRDDVILTHPLMEQQENSFLIANIRNFIIHCGKERDSYCCLLDGRVIRVHSFELVGTNSKVAIGIAFDNSVDLFHHPCNSGIIDVFKISLLKKAPVRINVSEISHKCQTFPLSDNEFAIFPLLHTVIK